MLRRDRLRLARGDTEEWFARDAALQLSSEAAEAEVTALEREVRRVAALEQSKS